MDIYSFGMVCLFTLFHDVAAKKVSESHCDHELEGLSALGRSETASTRAILEHLKQEEELLRLARTMILSNEDLGQDVKDSLVSLFDGCLCLDAHERKLSMENFLEFSDRKRYGSKSFDLEILMNLGLRFNYQKALAIQSLPLDPGNCSFQVRSYHRIPVRALTFR